MLAVLLLKSSQPTARAQVTEAARTRAHRALLTNTARGDNIRRRMLIGTRYPAKQETGS